jgi:hypothetical protein
MKIIPNVCFAALVALAASSVLGCATIISGTSQAISIDSNVPGANVAIEGSLVGVTPFSGKVKRQREAVALVSHEGYVAQPLTLTTSFNPVAILSIVWDYSTTDCLTGACWEYAPNSYYVKLVPEGTAEADFKREASLVAFAMTYFGDLQTELSAGAGPKLQAMRNEFFAEHSLDQFVTAMKALPQSDAIVFGESTAGLVVL